MLSAELAESVVKVEEEIFNVLKRHETGIRSTYANVT